MLLKTRFRPLSVFTPCLFVDIATTLNNFINIALLLTLLYKLAVVCNFACNSATRSKIRPVVVYKTAG